MMHLFRAFFLLFFLHATPAAASVNTARYGISIATDSTALHKQAEHSLDSIIAAMPMIQQAVIINDISPIHITEDKTLDFYLLLCLCFLLGTIKTIDPRYFQDLWRAFINPTLGNRQLKDIIQSSTIPNLLMNLFFSIVLAVYIFYLLSINKEIRFTQLSHSIILLCLVVVVILVYILKYAFVNFTGWVFNISSVTEQYNFNVFLINKIIGIGLLPFVIFFAFLNASWMIPLTIISAALLIFLLLNRYLRSWNIFGPFFHNSRFHFFMYLCAFEILPMAILLKVVLGIMLGWA